LGATVLSIADESFENLSPDLRNSLNEYWKVSSLENTEEVKAAVRELQARYGPGDDWRVESMNEYWLGLEATIREEFNIAGYKLKDLTRIKRKSGMKEVYNEAKVPCTKGKVLNSEQEVLMFVHEVGFPLIVKPDIGVGAADTHRLNNEKDVQNFFATKNNVEYIFEEFIDGFIESFDGLVDRDGKIVFYTSHIFNNGIMEVVVEDSELTYHSVREVPKDLTEYGFNTIKASGLKEKFFHLEFFRKKKRPKTNCT